MKKALFLSLGEYPPFKGGIAVFAQSLVRQLSGRYQVIVLASRPRSSRSDVGGLGAPGVVYRPRLGHKLGLNHLLGQVYPFLFAVLTRPDLVLITDPLSFKSARTLLRLKRFFPQTPAVLCLLHGTEIEDISGQKGLVSRSEFLASLASINGYLVNSRFTARLLKRRFKKVDQKKIRVLYPTVPEAFLNLKPTVKEATKVLAKFKIQKNRYFLSIGRLVKRKGHDRVLLTLTEVIKDHPQLQYVVIGQGPERARLLRLARKLQLGNNFVLTGEVSEVAKKVLLKNCLFYVHPSLKTNEIHQRVEGFGIAIIEAFSQGKAAVAFAHGGIPEIITDQENGLLIEPGNQEQLARSLRAVIDKPQLCSRLGQGARRCFEKKFSPLVFAREVEKLWPVR